MCTSPLPFTTLPNVCQQTPYSVIGLSDGLTVPFALTAGLSSLGDSKLVVLGGVAELIAGAISMGIGGFLASQSERDHYRYQRRSTAARVNRSCDGEIEREVAQVLGPVGVDEKICSSVAKCLRDLELESEGSGSDSRPSTIEDGGLKWSKDVGVTAFLIKFGEGLGTLTPSVRTFDPLPYFFSMRFRGNTRQANVHLRVDDRSRLPSRRPHPPPSLFLHQRGFQGSHLLVCCHRDGVVDFRCGEGSSYRCRHR